MSYERVTEILKKDKLVDVDCVASLLGVKRFVGESEETYRTRAAYAMMVKLYKEDGKIISDKVLDRIKNWELKAKTEESLAGVL